MTNRTPCWLRGCPCEGGTAARRFRSLASVLLLLAILVVSAKADLHAQPGPGPVPEKREVDVPNAPPSVPAGTIVPAPQLVTPGTVAAPAQPLRFTIDPKSTLKDLLPTPPKNPGRAGPLLGNDLSRVPEVRFEAADGAVHDEALKRIAHQMAKINHLNDKKTDGFLEALRGERPDLTGLPFAMGDACRTKGERSKQFAHAVATVRQALQSPAPVSGPTPATPSAVPMGGGGPAPATTSGGFAGFSDRSARTVTTTALRSGSENSFSIVFSTPVSVNSVPPETFWEQYQTLCSQQDKPQTRREQRETITLARLAALAQILMPMPEMHPGLVKYLATVSHVEATKALARLALFSSEEDARKAALDALKIRRERDYTDILVNGLCYPWPAVARRAAEAITKLERNDLLPQLLDVLEQPDPRAPVMRQIKDKRVPVVRELVRVNHHRSCLLCHEPGNTGKVSSDAVTAEVPVPGQPLNPPSGPYNASRQEILVRVDVTYLRQDFSALQAVADANPWPEMQRFDFLVRSRVLSEDEAETYRAKLKPRESGQLSPYQRAALAALRDLTGRDTAPTPEAWRQLLKLTAESQHKTASP